MASEVGQLAATVAGKGFDEAAQLFIHIQSVSCPSAVVFCLPVFNNLDSTYGARWDIRELSIGKAGRNEGDESVGELHLECIVLRSI